MEELGLLDDAGLRRWAREHGGEAAALLAASMRGSRGAAGEFASALEHLSPSRRRADVATVAGLWFALPLGLRQEWTVRYPGVIGPLNGVDFPSRVRANIIVAAGLLHQLTAEAEDAKSRGFWGTLRRGLRAAFRVGHVRRQLDGLHQAVHREDAPIQLLFASDEADGQFVVLSGELSDATRTVAVMVPGTLTYGNHLAMNIGRLRDVDGREVHPDTAVGLYWQGTEFPRFVTDNADRRFNRAARERLSAFDAALDLEAERVCTPGAAPAPQTYIGHSYGASAIGSAESLGEGLTLDRLVYVGAPGTGFQVDLPADTANPDADRYALVAPADLTPWLGGALFGRALGGDPVREMGAVRLETGFLDHAGRRQRLVSHNDYLRGGSTSALNIRAVVLGQRTLPAVVGRPWPWGRISDRRLARRINGLRLPR
ncbi:hypothetical protein [Galactobacter caseinivorans]|uniref:Alpha/beta hydrolase n=1 Tax=Galactobacter caseinivorans TaxID=2676123 RepID=A0A496PK27_9MICC|nr:hypothetical protein [Galactobacter caseinivorans]RKW70790.1 hypothetical protein DWQ67_06760 [Galactobacter caseinivorans]